MRENKCRKCGDRIPWSTVIDGKKRNLQRRSFCLKCSPYGSHNTKTDDPSRLAKHNGQYRNWTDGEKLLHKARNYKLGIQRKEKIVEMSGGKCIKCGYNKCQKALSFHHRNPSEKMFGLDMNMLRNHSWEEILCEVKKCDLLCVRCHMEIEDEMCPVNEKSYRAIIEKLL